MGTVPDVEPMMGLSFGRAISVVAAEDPDRPAVTGWEPDGTHRTVTRAELRRADQSDRTGVGCHGNR